MTVAADPLFLTADELVTLTGRRTRPAQIEALRRMGVAFRVNAIGAPVVTRAAVLGQADVRPAKSGWAPPATG